ncbi:MAG TPA: HAD family phosphatase [Candidatus Saccharimonadales bacterium]
MIRGIIFDCFGVLYQGSIAHLYELTPEAKRSQLADLSLSSDYGYISADEFLQQVVELTGKTAAELKEIMQADHVRNQAMVEYVRTFKGRYKVGLLSNVGRGVMERLFTSAELDELFDEVVLSSEVGMIKPDPAIYQLAADRLGVETTECVMVDDLVANIDGAESTGMHGVVFTTTSKCMQDMTSLLA